MKCLCCYTEITEANFSIEKVYCLSCYPTIMAKMRILAENIEILNN